MTLEFTSDEVEILKEMVERRIKELGPEIHHTHYRAYKAGLIATREKLSKMLEHLCAIESSAVQVT